MIFLLVHKTTHVQCKITVQLFYLYGFLEVLQCQNHAKTTQFFNFRQKFMILCAILNMKIVIVLMSASITQAIAIINIMVATVPMAAELGLSSLAHVFFLVWEERLYFFTFSSFSISFRICSFCLESILTLCLLQQNE